MQTTIFKHANCVTSNQSGTLGQSQRIQNSNIYQRLKNVWCHYEPVYQLILSYQQIIPSFPSNTPSPVATIATEKAYKES